MTSVAVIGGGPAGLTAGYVLAKQGLKPVVFEAGPHLGGMARSFELWGQVVDLGPHRFFSGDPRVNSLWLEAVGRDYRMVDRLTRIYYNRRFFYYPLRLGNVLSQLGPFEAVHCLLSYLRQVVSPEMHEDSFEGWVTSRFGRRLYEIFFKTYSEKLWGIPGDRLDSDFAAQRIRKLSFFEAVKTAVLPGGGNEHKTLVDQFAYPLRGCGLAYERLAEAIVAKGGEVRRDSPVRRVITHNGVVTGVELDGQVYNCEQVISSMPLTLLVEGLGPPAEVRQACQRLKFRNTIIVYLRVAASELFPDNWLYIHAPDLSAGRVTNFRNWVPQICQGSGDTILAVEYWSNSDQRLWNTADEQLIELASREMEQTGLTRGSPIIDGKVVRVPRCYPVYERGYREHLKVIMAFLNRFEGLQAIGRYGSFKYNNQDHSILMGLLAAENVGGAGNHSLWDINSDTEYQENSRISSSGLVTVR